MDLSRGFPSTFSVSLERPHPPRACKSTHDAHWLMSDLRTPSSLPKTFRSATPPKISFLTLSSASSLARNDPKAREPPSFKRSNKYACSLVASCSSAGWDFMSVSTSRPTVGDARRESRAACRAASSSTTWTATASERVKCLARRSAASCFASWSAAKVRFQAMARSCARSSMPSANATSRNTLWVASLRPEMVTTLMGRLALSAFLIVAARLAAKSSLERSRQPYDLAKRPAPCKSPFATKSSISACASISASLDPGKSSPGQCCLNATASDSCPSENSLPASSRTTSCCSGLASASCTPHLRSTFSPVTASSSANAKAAVSARCLEAESSASGFGRRSPSRGPRAALLGRWGRSSRQRSRRSCASLCGIFPRAPFAASRLSLHLG
mmetsp:Transcript_33157/g.95327  ORF Transcript_33157/g.95327 Transcript_33157/m.95327 type:complete len:387 (+) Transcript_33157:94-1254(+)